MIANMIDDVQLAHFSENKLIRKWIAKTVRAINPETTRQCAADLENVSTDSKSIILIINIVHMKHNAVAHRFLYDWELYFIAMFDVGLVLYY